MQKNYFKKAILLIGDIIILYLSLYLALWLRYFEQPNKEIWRSHLMPFTFIFFIWVITLYIFNFYNLSRIINRSKFYQLLTRVLATATALSIIFFYIYRPADITPKTNLLIFVACFALLFLMWRKISDYFLFKKIAKNKIAIIGYSEKNKELIKELLKKEYLGYKIIFIADLEEENNNREFCGIPIIKNIEEVKKIAINKNITTIILNSENELKARTLLFDLLANKISFIKMPNFYESVTGKIPIKSIDEMWFLENLSEGTKNFFDKFKRFYDIFLSLIILIVTIVFWPLIALIIKTESKGPVFIKMPRLGQGEKIFKMYKFRSMREENNQRTMTIKDDPRITRFGSFMRKTRIDEIPQVLNILRGDMSFVGPRPERPELARELATKIPFLNERTLVKPGITGWDQISGQYHSPSVEDTLEKIQYDLFYIKNRSIYLDLSIVLKTISTILLRQGR